MMSVCRARAAGPSCELSTALCCRAGWRFPEGSLSLAGPRNGKLLRDVMAAVQDTGAWVSRIPAWLPQFPGQTCSRLLTSRKFKSSTDQDWAGNGRVYRDLWGNRLSCSLEPQPGDSGNPWRPTDIRKAQSWLTGLQEEAGRTLLLHSPPCTQTESAQHKEDQTTPCSTPSSTPQTSKSSSQ